MKISVNGKIVVVTLRAWSETQERWGQDFFGDVETLDFDWKKWDADNEVWAICEDDYQAMIDYWQAEVDKHNARQPTDEFNNDGIELCLEAIEECI